MSIKQIRIEQVDETEVTIIEFTTNTQAVTITGTQEVVSSSYKVGEAEQAAAENLAATVNNATEVLKAIVKWQQLAADGHASMTVDNQDHLARAAAASIVEMSATFGHVTGVKI